MSQQFLEDVMQEMMVHVDLATTSTYVSLAKKVPGEPVLPAPVVRHRWPAGQGMGSSAYLKRWPATASA
jgi:hypothetical protein